METAPNLRPDAFAGTAKAYLRFRPPYSARLLEALLARVDLPRGAILLDLACGPGRIALALAHRFDRVWAVDLEPEMIAVGRTEGERLGISNVAWIIGAAEQADIPSASVDLITIGEAFHRLDQASVLANALRWLKPGGWIAALWTDGPLSGGAGWKGEVARIAKRFFPVGWVESRPGAASPIEAFRRVGFVDVQDRAFSEPWAWSLEAIVGYLRSTSVCSDLALGGDSARLEAELRCALGGDGPFHDELRCGYTAARKPD
ncbi:MAG: class I SAM-dependent methyltransferase [Caulobacteraceae bacterium]